MSSLHLLAPDRAQPPMAGSVFGPRAHTPYGHVHQPSGPILGFSGQPRDRVTGCYHLGNGHRSYNPVLMRFHSADRLSPFGKGGINAYAYCGNDPVNRADPSGQSPAWLGPLRSFAAGVANLLVTAVGAYRNYKIERDFDISGRYAGSRAGELALNTAETPLNRWSVRDKALATLGGVSAGMSMGTASARLAGADGDVLAWVDMAFGFVATAISFAELYSIATAPMPERYPVHGNQWNARSDVSPIRTTAA